VRSPAMRAFICFLFLVALHCGDAYRTPAIRNDTEQCFEDRECFDAYCKENFNNGTTDGGRCYFLADIGKSWDDAWAVCRKYGAVLAQPHTASEYAKITNYANTMANRSDYSIRMPLKDNNVRPTCLFTPGSTHFYENATTPSSLLKVEKTWLYKYHNCDSKDTASEGVPRCLVLFHWTIPNGPLYLGDFYCSYAAANYLVMCEISNYNQDYTKTAAGVCLNEQSIENITTTNPRSCAAECSQRQWCRSFNFIKPTRAIGENDCQLFSWSSKDTNRTVIDHSCFHYDYVP